MKNADLSVIIPTYYRYDSLRQVLIQLEQQTVRPREIVVADQTPAHDVLMYVPGERLGRMYQVPDSSLHAA